MTSMRVPGRRPISSSRPRCSAATSTAVTVPALPGGSELRRWPSAAMGARPLWSLRRNGLNHDIIGQPRTDAEPRVAHQANQVCMAAHQLDFLLLAKSNLAQTIRQLRRCIQPLDAHGSARDHPAERAKLRLAMAIFQASWHSSVHGSDIIVIETRFQLVIFDLFYRANEPLCRGPAGLSKAGLPKRRPIG